MYVDGYYAGIVDDFDGTFQRLRVPPGEHELVIYLEGYRSTKQNILFRPRAGYKINASLEKLADGEQAEPRPKPSPDTNPQRTPGGAPGIVAATMPIAANRGAASRRRRQGSVPSLCVSSLRARRSSWTANAGRAPTRAASASSCSWPKAVTAWRCRETGYQPYATDVEVRSGETATLNVSLPQERR